MLNLRGIQLLLVVAAWTISGGVCDTCSTSCVRSLQNVPCVPLRDDYVNVPGVGAYKLHTVAADWDTARNTCQQEGGNLAVPNSAAEAKAITTIFANGGKISDTNNQNNALIGFHDQFKEGEYVTIFDQPLSESGFNRFVPGEPNNLDGAENCGAITKAGLLNDISCTRKYGFVCELALCNSCLSP